jgi:hypothetical protein
MAASLPCRDVTLAAFQEALLAVVQMEPRGQRLGAQDRSATAQGQQDVVVRLGRRSRARRCSSSTTW